MRMSLEPRPGHVQVIGGRVLRIAKEHAVPTGTQRGVFNGNKYVYCGQGDLVVEAMEVDGKRLGYSFLTGKATNLFAGGALCQTCEPETVDPVLLRVLRFNFPMPDEASGDDIVEVFREIKHGSRYDRTVIAFQLEVAGDHDVFVSAVIEMWKLASRGDHGSSRSSANLMGIVKGRDGYATFHRGYAEQARGPEAFQLGLVLSSPLIETMDVPWAR